MRVTSQAITFLEALGVYLKEYSKSRASYVLCFRTPTRALVATLRSLRVISPNDAICYHTFLRGKIVFVILIPFRFRSYALSVAAKTRARSAASEIFLWHRGRNIAIDYS